MTTVWIKKGTRHTMEHIVCAVHDRQLDAYMRPFTAASKGQAIRSFRDEVNRADSELHKHPEDYELYQVGTFNENTGELRDHLEQLAIATNLLERT